MKVIDGARRVVFGNPARERGTSVYFPRRVIPMLPEALSNELCSLRPDVDRLCMACDMEISAQGVIKAFRFYPAVMHSKARLTYTRAIRRALADAGYEDLPRAGARVIGRIANGGTSVAEVAGAYDASKQAASKLVDALVLRG